MDLLIAILMFLGVIFTNNSYTNEEIDQYYLDNKPDVDNIMNDEQQSQQCLYDFNAGNTLTEYPTWVDIRENDPTGN